MRLEQGEDGARGRHRFQSVVGTLEALDMGEENITVVVWRDDGYGLIDWKQRDEFGRPFGVELTNPDFVAYAQSFSLAAFRPSSAADLYPTLLRALEHDGPALVDVPIDYRENLRLTERLGGLSHTG